MPEMRLTTFGGLRVYGDDGRELRLPTRKAAALLIYLSMDLGRAHAREKLRHLLWADRPERHAQQSLRQALSDIRRVCGSDVVVANTETVQIRADRVRIDAADVIRLASAGDLASLEKAEQLCQGEFLAHSDIGLPAFDEWLAFERERFSALVQAVLGKLISLSSGSRSREKRIVAIRTLLAMDPFNEAMHRLLLKVYADQGQMPLAIAHYRRLCEDLKRELGVKPEDTTSSLFNNIVARPDSRLDRVQTLAQFVFVLEQLPHPVVVTDALNHIVGWNGLAEEAFGFTKNEMCGRSPTLVYAPNRDHTLADLILKHALRSGSWHGNVELVGKDGSRCRQRRIVAPLFGPSGELLGAFGHGLQDAPTSSAHPF